MNTIENNLEQNQKKEWEEKCIEAKKIIKELFNEVGKNCPKEELFDKLPKITEECLKTLEKSQKEISEYAAYHILVGSSPNYKRSPNFDFPGENTIINFIKKKIEELKNRET